MCKKVIVIGSGLGGLATGVMLAKNGYEVTVLEQGAQIGGCLQCFVRKGAKFETGMHFIGSADYGQPLDTLLRFLEIRDSLQLDRLDADGYDVVCLDGQRYRIPNGREAFIAQLSAYFPYQHDNLVRYYDLIEKVAGASSLHSLRFDVTDTATSMEYQLRSINEVIDSVITDPQLAKVLVGNLPLYAAELDKTPFSTHAFIMDFYNQSAYRIAGGSDHIASALRRVIEHHGGSVRTRSKVTRIICDEQKATGVEVNSAEFLPSDYIVSDAHPMRTLEMLDTKLIRPVFRSRINSIRQGVGCFTLYLRFKDDTVPYMNHNFYGFEDNTPWGCEHYDNKTWPKGYLYMHLCHEPHPQYAKTAEILSYMHMSEVEQWRGTAIGHRGADYLAFKAEKAEKLLSVVERQFPGLRDAIADVYTSTPLTYLDYTGTEDGSMYGIAKDVSLGAACRVPHKLRVPNVFLTGQNINSHGMLGVLVGSIVTAGELVPPQLLFEQIKKASR